MPLDTYQGDNDNNCEIETQFVGRGDDLGKLEAEWRRHRIFGIFGIRAVGKSRLVKEFINRKLDENKCFRDQQVDGNAGDNDSLHHEVILKVITIDMLLQENVNTLYAYMCASLGLTPEAQATETNKWKRQIVDEIKKRQESVIICFDNAENVVEGDMRDEVLSLCSMLAKQCPSSKLIFTSTTQILFSQIGKVYIAHELLPLKTSEARLLLRSVTPQIDMGQCEDTILQFSEGLPLLILMIGSELVEDNGMITPEEMVEMLATFRLRALSREFYPEEDRVADVYKKFIERLHDKYRDHLSVLEFIPGSFNISEARELLGLETDALAKNQAAIPLRRRHMLNYDSSHRRFVIQGILKECLRDYFAIKNLPEIRKRYHKIFSMVMREIASTLGTEEYTKALSEFTLEQPNLQKLLNEVIHTEEDTYPFFIQVVEKCTGLIENFMMNESDTFYDGCLVLADRYDREGDKAIVYIAVGSMATNVKSASSSINLSEEMDKEVKHKTINCFPDRLKRSDFPRGAEKYAAALRILEKQGNALQLATAYQRMGWNLHSQGRNLEAIGYFNQSMEISLTYPGKEAQLLALQSFNSLGLTHTVIGNFEQAEKYHFTSLERRKMIQGKEHPSIGATLNNIGVFYDQKGEPEKAIEYYLQGLEFKRRGKFPPTTLAYSLSNIANHYGALKQWDRAHEMLDEAMTLLNEQKITPKDAIALIYDTRGKVFMSERKFDEASAMFGKAVEMREILTPKGISFFESLMHLAQALRRQGRLSSSLKIINKLTKLYDTAIKAMPQNTFITEWLECLANIYEQRGETNRYVETLDKVQSELIRLERFHLSQCNDRNVEKIRKQLNELDLRTKNVEDEDLYRRAC